MFSILVTNLSDHSIEEIAFNDFPAICPHCNIGVDFKPTSGYETSAGYFIVAECPHCRYLSLFHAQINQEDVINLIPSIKQVLLSENLKELSPKFCEVYKQTQMAYDYGLVELVGIGFGKAIEFLVDDYLIKVQEEAPKGRFVDKINSLKNFDDAAISLSFARLVRNDESHPNKRSEFSLTDLIDAVECIKVFFDAKYSTYKLKKNIKQNK